MEAFGVQPNSRGTARLLVVDSPSLPTDQVLIRTIAVGLCGTDRELVDGEFGTAPPGEKFLIMGHEGLGSVESPGASGFQRYDLVVPIVRRPDPVPCDSCARGEWDMCENGQYVECGLTAAHGFLVEYFVDEPNFLVKIPSHLGVLGVLAEPMSIVEKALERLNRSRGWLDPTVRRCLIIGCGSIGTLAALRCRLENIELYVYSEPRGGIARGVVEDAGASFIGSTHDELELPAMLDGMFDFVIEASGATSLFVFGLRALRRNGVMCLLGLSSGRTSLSVDLAGASREMVLQNKTIVGSVNSNRRHYEGAVNSLVAIASRWPGLLDRVITERVGLRELSSELIQRPRELKLVATVG